MNGDENVTNGEKMVAYCRAQVGKPYKLGASGLSAFDCSGLTKKAAKLMGLDWYHGASTQWHRGFEAGSPARYGYWEKSGTIDAIPVDETVFLFHQDATATAKIVMAHTGIYDGVARHVIQAGGYGGKGVHEGTLDKRRWSHWAKPFHTDDESASTDTDTVTASTESFPSTIRRGSKGDAVKRLQGLLNANGAELVVDGDFGRLTEAAVKAYQSSKGLEADGVVGKITCGVLLG